LDQLMIRAPILPALIPIHSGPGARLGAFLDGFAENAFVTTRAPL
jgi:hypothetical protein